MKFKHFQSFSLQVRNTLNCLKPFIRWMDGTCLETQEQVFVFFHYYIYLYLLSYILSKQNDEHLIHANF